MENRRRRPKSSPRKTGEAAEQALVEAREKYPDWGAPKLVKILAQQEPAVKLQVRTAHRILERRGLIPPGERRSRAAGRFEREAPNELWQMDFKGPQGFNKGGGVGPLSILDDHSRFLLELRNLGSTRARGVRETLEETFAGNGMPDKLLLDHGTPWWNAASPWGWTELTVWIMRLGVCLIYSGIRHPQTQGKVERMHGALQRAIRHRQGDPGDQAWLDRFRYEYNHVRPHGGIGMETPASRWRPSNRPYPCEIAEWEYEPLLEVHRLGQEGQLGWRGRRWEISNALRGLLVGIEVLESRAIVYFCRTPMRELNLETGEAVPISTKPIRSLPSV